MFKWNKEDMVVPGVVAFLVLLVIWNVADNVSTKPEQAKTPTTQSQTTNSKPVLKPTTTPQQPAVPKYDLVGEFGNGGKAYVIAPGDATIAKLTLIGKDLDKKYGSDDFARIGIYTEREQAQIIVDDPLGPGNLEGDAADAYDKAYVAQFNVNKYSGFKKFFVMLNGKQTEINL